ncbi:MAG: methylated-DNA--[protein]-cysteine S-methyltransferase [Phycisphaerae bacterium]|nr:methylated-DNA--[protein]-cysteine S-methyltransferase [Phycisphaerae bacterium]
MLTVAIIETDWGYFALAASTRGVLGTILPVPSLRRIEQLARRRWPEAKRDDGLLKDLQDQIVAYYQGRRAGFRVSLDLADVTPFRRRVLKACAKIPYARTKTYQQLAEIVGSPRAARAVGGAMAHNPIPLIIPCHRVLAASGRLGGFSAEGGVAIKRRMLAMEARCRT